MRRETVRWIAVLAYFTIAGAPLVSQTPAATGQIERFSEDIVRRWPAAGSAGTVPASIPFERSFAAPVGTYVLQTRFWTTTAAKPRQNDKHLKFSLPGPYPS